MRAAASAPRKRQRVRDPELLPAAPLVAQLQPYGVPPHQSSLWGGGSASAALHAWQARLLQEHGAALFGPAAKNLVFHAPTSSGKTLVAEVIIYNALKRRKGTVLYVVRGRSLPLYLTTRSPAHARRSRT